MKQAERLSRIRAIESEEASSPEGWYWLSYADEERFWGANIVRAKGVISAIKRANELGIDPTPKSQVIGYPIRPDDALPNIHEYANRLLTWEDVQKMNGRVQ